jgi:membrane protein required for colicin V production
MEILKQINWLDILVIILLLRSVYIGVKLGLTAELFNFFGVLVSLVCAVIWYSWMADFLVINFKLPIWLSQFLCFIIIAQIVRLIFKYSLALLLKLLNVQFIPQLERIGGAVIGFGRGIILAGIIIVAIGILPNNYIRESIEEKSYSGRFLVKAVENTYEALTFWLPEQEGKAAIFDLTQANR